MNRKWASKVENNKLSENFHKLDFSLETLPQILNRLLENEKYETEDIRLVSQHLFNVHRCCFEKQFVITCSKDQLKKVLKQKISGLDKIPFFIMHDMDDRHWVVFCLLEINDKKVLLCKSSCDTAKSNVENIIKEYLAGLNTCFKLFNDNSFSDQCCCGPLSLENLNIMLVQFKINQDNFVKNFDTIKFASSKAAAEIRKIFTSNLQEYLAKVLTHDILSVAKDTEFKKAVVEFIDTYLNYLNLLSSSDHYIKVLQNVASKSEENVDEINLNEIEKAKNAFLNHPVTKELLQKQICQNLNIEEQKENKIINSDISLNIQKKFPEQMKKFTGIFNFLVKTKDHESSKSSLKLVCEKFGLELCKIEKFFTEQNKNSEQKNVSSIEFQIKNENKIKSHVQSSRSSQQIRINRSIAVKTGPDSEEKTFKVLLEELTSTIDSKCISRFPDHYNKMKTLYQKWKNKDESGINNWAKNVKGKLRDEEILEALAIMDRANEIVTGGHRLRDTQILTLLIFLQNMSKSHICQIHTGEGKTTTISLLATLKVLQGKCVDVITSNEVLANEGVNNREEFFHLFNISVGTNNTNSSYNEDTKACYSSDIVYGTIGNFQFDYLTDSFEGLQTRGGRGFGTVILDEVDSMLIDNGSYIAKLTGPFPGMDSLKYVYLKIWQELCNAEKNMLEEFQKSLENKAGDSVEEHLQYKLLQKDISELRSKVKESNPSNISLIPAHLKEYASSMVDKWIDNAFYARYECLENEEYVIKKMDREDVIVPVDYQNTGVLLKNTIWCNGLHQFVQLKHNLSLTTESLTSSFISNIGYIKLYNQEVFGVTGTLGSKAEQQLLSKIYSLSYTEIPSFKTRKFYELEGLVVEDHLWSTFIAICSLMFTHKGRSVLVICRTIRDLKGIKNKVTYFKKSRNFNEVKVKTYPDEDSSSIVNVEVGLCEIIIATNIAGRGTDFKTSCELEENGGLHVCVGFLPVNQRVEDQAFGRTARQGSSGTAQLIIRNSDVVEIGIDAGEISNTSFQRIKVKRNLVEVARLQEVQNEKLAEIDFQDNLFSEFSKIYREFQMSLKEDASNLYLAKDLKEFWAFWLHKNSFRGNNLKEINVNCEFKRFLSEAKDILGPPNSDRNCVRKITHNPYYSIQQAEYFLDRNEYAKAKAALTHALELNVENDNLLHSAHMKLFEVAVESGCQMHERFKKAVQGVLFFDILKDIEKDDNYKLKARDALEKAKSSIGREIDYIKQNFFNLDEVSNEVGPVYSVNSSFQNVLTVFENNLLLKHINSRFVALDIFFHHSKSLLLQVESSLQEHNLKGLVIKARIPHYLRKLDSNTEHGMFLKEALSDDDLSELSSVGLDTIYAVENVHDVPQTVIKSAQVQIGAGLSLIGGGVAFPPAVPFLAPLASILISEGISDIIMELISQGASEFNSEAYFKSKCISYFILLITFGIKTIVESSKMLDYAIKQNKKLFTWLNAASAKFKSVLDSLTKEIATLTNFKYASSQTTSISKLVAKPLNANRAIFLCKFAIQFPTITTVTCAPVLTYIAWKYFVPMDLKQQWCSNRKRGSSNPRINTERTKSNQRSDDNDTNKDQNNQQNRKPEEQPNANNQKGDGDSNDQNQESEDSDHEDKNLETQSSEEESDEEESEEELNNNSNMKRGSSNPRNNTKRTKSNQRSDDNNTNKDQNSQQNRKPVEQPNANNQKGDGDSNDQNQESEDSDHEDKNLETQGSEEESYEEESEEELNSQHNKESQRRGTGEITNNNSQKNKKLSVKLLVNHSAEKYLAPVVKQLENSCEAKKSRKCAPSFYDPSFNYECLEMPLFFGYITNMVEVYLKNGEKSICDLDRILSGCTEEFSFVGSYNELNRLFPGRLGYAEINHCPPSQSYKNTPYEHINLGDMPCIVLPKQWHRRFTPSTGSSYESKEHRKKIQRLLQSKGGFYAALYYEIKICLKMYKSIYLTWKNKSVPPYNPFPSLEKLIKYCRDANVPSAPSAPGVPPGKLISEDDCETLLSLLREKDQEIEAIYKRFPTVGFPGGFVHMPSWDKLENSSDDNDDSDESNSNDN